MISYLLKQKKSEFIFLILSSLFCVGLSFSRALYTNSKVFLFLNWNLFLAFLPWLFSTLALVYPSLQKRLISRVAITFSWLLFFPNAPYILTDLFHLKLRTTMPEWFDLVLILSFAWTGLIYGFISLSNIEQILFKGFKSESIYMLSGLLLFLSSFGIYLGRFLRWNSWDIISRPNMLINDIWIRVSDPLSHPGTWGITILMGLLLNMIYLSFKLLNSSTKKVAFS